VFSTIVVSLSCPLYVIDTLCFCAFWTKKDRQINEVHAIEKRAVRACRFKTSPRVLYWTLRRPSAPPVRRIGNCAAVDCSVCVVYRSLIERTNVATAVSAPRTPCNRYTSERNTIDHPPPAMQLCTTAVAAGPPIAVGARFAIHADQCTPSYFTPNAFPQPTTPGRTVGPTATTHR